MRRAATASFIYMIRAALLALALGILTPAALMAAPAPPEPAAITAEAPEAPGAPALLDDAGAASAEQLPSVSDPRIAPPRGWETRHTRYFRIHSDPSDRASADLLAREIDGWMESAAARVGQPIRGSVDLLLAPSYEAFMAVQPGDAPPWAVGTAYSNLGLITVRAPRAAPAQTDYSLRQTTVHEIAHIVLGWAFGERQIPRWIHEGLAKYVAGETTWETRIHLSRAVLTGNLIPLSELAGGFPRSNARASLAYAESLEFLSFLIDEYGPDVIPRLIAQLADGQPIDRAIAAVTSVDFAELEEQWHTHLQLNFAWLPALTTGGGLWVFASLLLLAGWGRKKWESRKRRERWAVEEALIYGSPYEIGGAEPAAGPLGQVAWPRHLRVIEGGALYSDTAQPPQPDDEPEVDGLGDEVEVPRMWGYVDEGDDDDDRPPPGGWLH